MNGRQRFLNSIDQLRVLLSCLLVLGCLMVQGASINVLVGALSRVQSKETTEESKCEADFFEVSHKCARCRCVSLRSGGNVQTQLRPEDEKRPSCSLPAEVIVRHLLGAGISIRS